MTLANRPAKLTGVNTVQFFIPDGKHRKQVFAMHGLDDGSLSIFLPNVLDDAFKPASSPSPPSRPKTTAFCFRRARKRSRSNLLDRDTLNPQFYFKDMTGWNRKAIQVTIPSTASAAQKHTVEQLAALAATGWPADAV